MTEFKLLGHEPSFLPDGYEWQGWSTTAPKTEGYTPFNLDRRKISKF